MDLTTIRRGSKTLHIITAASDNATVINSPGLKISSIYAFNVGASAYYMKLYDKSTTPTASDTPFMTINIPAVGTIGSYIYLDLNDYVVTNGLGVRITTGYADNDTGATTAGNAFVNINYKP